MARRPKAQVELALPGLSDLDELEAPAPHTCHAIGCARRVPPEMLMCKAHWMRVPMPIRRAVWGAYRRGQCDDMRPSRAWFEAANAAIGAVGLLENRPISRAMRDALGRHGA
jgi:hypothetical protein